MGEDSVFMICFGLFLVVVLSLPLSLSACIAASRTRTWAKEKTGRNYTQLSSSDLEADPLVDSDAEDDFLDAEDEEYYNAKRQQKQRERDEEQADRALSTRAKFFKEWAKCWKGPNPEQRRLQEQELKAQDERRKIAREAVREYLRIERRKARKAALKQGGDNMELPTYGKAVADGEKQ